MKNSKALFSAFLFGCVLTTTGYSVNVPVQPKPHVNPPKVEHPVAAERLYMDNHTPERVYTPDNMTEPSFRKNQREVSPEAPSGGVPLEG